MTRWTVVRRPFGDERDELSWCFDVALHEAEVLSSTLLGISACP